MPMRVQSVHTLASDDKNLQKFKERLETLVVDDLKQKNANGDTILHCAAEGKACLNMELIVKKLEISNDHSALFIKNKKGQTVAHIAADHSEENLIECILKELNVSQRFDVLKQVDKRGQTPLHMAAKNDKRKTVQYLLDSLVQEADKSKAIDLICIKDICCRTALHEVSRQGLTDMLMSLLHDIGLDTKQKIILYQDNMGRTPLHFMILSGIPETVIRILAEFNEPMKVKLLTAAQKGGHTLLHVATTKDCGIVLQPILQCLSEMHCDNRKKVLMAKDNLGRNILHSTVQEKCAVALKTVLDFLDTDERCFLLGEIDHEGDTAVHHAASMEDPTILTIILDCVEKPQHRYKMIAFPDGLHLSSLHRAVISNSADIVEGLLKFFEHSAIINLLGLSHPTRQTPLHIAIEKNNKIITHIFTTYLKHLPAGEPMQIISTADTKAGRTWLHTAVRHKNADAVAALLPLISQEEKLGILLRRDADGNIVFHDAVALGGKEVVAAILSSFEHPEERYRLIKRKDGKQRNSLHCAALAGSAETMKLILEAIPYASAVVLLNRKQQTGQTPLLLAISKCKKEIVEVIMNFLDNHDRFALVADPNHNGETSLHIAAFKQIESVGETGDVTIKLERKLQEQKRVFLKGLEKSQVTEDTPMVLQSLIGEARRQDAKEIEQPKGSHAEIINFILSSLGDKRIAALKQKDLFGHTPLHIAAALGSALALENMLASVNSSTVSVIELAMETNDEGQNPLHIACNNSRVDLIESILKCIPLSELGELLCTQDLQGKTPLHLVLKPHKQKTVTEKQAQPAQLVDLLLGNVARCHSVQALLIKDLNGETPLLTAIKEKDSKAVKYLLKNLEIKDATKLIKDRTFDGKTPLGEALQSSPLVDLLLKHFADQVYSLLGLRNAEGQTILYLAAMEANPNLVSILIESVKSEKEKLELLSMKDFKGQNVLHAASTKFPSSLEKFLQSFKMYETIIQNLLCLRDDCGKIPAEIATHNLSRRHLQQVVSKATDYLSRDGIDEVLSPVANSSKQILELLLANRTSKSEQTKLHLAAQWKNIDVAQYIRGKLDQQDWLELLKAKDWLGNSVIHTAAQSDSVLEYVNNLEKTQKQELFAALNVWGENCLHLAVRSSSSEAVKDIIKEIDQSEVKRLLLQKDFKGQTVLHAAAKMNISLVSTLLLACGPNAKALLEETDRLGCCAAALAVDARLGNYMNTFATFYHLYKPPMCIIIFIDKNRKRADTEADRIDEAFKKIGMKPQVKEDPLKSEIFEHLKGVSTDQDISGLVVVIMAHGDRGLVYDYDDQKVCINHIISAMCTENLKDKPKLLLVQACQGQRSPEPKVLKRLFQQPAEHECDFDVCPVSGSAAHSAESSEREYDPVVRDPDILVQYATVPGDKAVRDHFIKEFSVQLDMSSEDDDVVTLLEKTHATMKDASNISCYQKPSGRHVMSKKLALKRVWLPVDKLAGG